MSTAKTTSLRFLPSIDQLLRNDAVRSLQSRLGLSHVTLLARQVTEEMRTEVQTGAASELTKDQFLQRAVEKLRRLADRESRSGIKRVINATGVILHTNLGRAPLSDAARDAVVQATGYCTLEYDSVSGRRGRRGSRVEELLVQLTGAESALVVNNCAAAALLILTTLAKDGETIVSRGELVEIGGDFRVPDVMANSGTRMIEVGSTNRTSLADYRQALTEKTRVIMKVHPSNYRVVGFTSSPTLAELTSLARESKIFLYEDAGSGAFENLSDIGLGEEPIIGKSISDGADVVSFSGDKLVGGSQAGLIVGRSEIVDRLRKHSLYRALRADKLCLAALESTLEAHRRHALDEIPTLKMLRMSQETVETRAKHLAELISSNERLTVNVVPGESAVGGGSGPNVHPKTALIALSHASLSAAGMEEQLRLASPPVITRIADNSVLIDLRTVDPRDEEELRRVIQAL